MTSDDIKRIELHDGDVLQMPLGTTLEQMTKLNHQLTALHPDKRFVLVAGDVELVPESLMAAAGWVRAQIVTLH